MPHVGLVFLDDLHAFAPWISDLAPAWARDRKLDGPLLAPAITPPPALVVVARPRGASIVGFSESWLRLAARVVVVLDRSLDPVPDGDPELRVVANLERDELRRALGPATQVVEVGAGGVDVAIGRALVIAADGPAAPWPALSPIEPRAACAPGPWIAWAPRESEPTLVDALRWLAPTLCWHGGRPAIVEVGRASRIDLTTGERTRFDGPAPRSFWPPAVSPDGTRWLCAHERDTVWSLVDAASTRSCGGGWGRPIGFDPSGRIAWSGGRSRFEWRVVTDDGPAYWTPSNHHWPCGHAKKLYNYADTEPLAVHLAADASACLSIYDRDTLVTPGLPLRWRDLGTIALAERAAGEPRALMFEHADRPFPADPRQADEDARDRFAVATLGPSSELRYTVGLAETTYRLAAETVERLGGPEPSWLVCDDRHRVVHRGTGRLLGGWDRWVVVEENGDLRREDLIAGTRTALGALDRPVLGAATLAGSPNVVLFTPDGGGAVRVV